MEETIEFYRVKAEALQEKSLDTKVL